MKEKILLAERGLCPFCKADHGSCSYEDIVIESGIVNQRASCGECKKEWFEVYTMTEIVDADEFVDFNQGEFDYQMMGDC